MKTNVQKNTGRDAKPQSSRWVTWLLVGLMLMMTPMLRAQCGMENKAFAPGEELNYTLYFNWKFIWAKAGTASLSVKQITHQGKPAYKMELQAIGNSRADYFFKMRDTITSVMSTTLMPIYYRKGSEEGKRYTVDEAHFSYPNGMPLVKQTRRVPQYGQRYDTEHPGKLCVYDMLSILAQARSYNPTAFKPGDRQTFLMATGRRVEEAALEYRGKETVKAEDGHTYRCLIFSFLEKTGKRKEKEIITFYISDDSNHLPIRLDMNLNFGSAKAYINSIKGNRHELTSVIK